jgi:hypothetical protein
VTRQERSWISAALDYAGGTHTLEDVEQAITEGKLTLLSDDRCALVLEIIVYPRTKVLNVFLAAGDLEAVKRKDPVLCALGRAYGCSRVTLSGRRGWIRALNETGYREGWAVAFKEL